MNGEQLKLKIQQANSVDFSDALEQCVRIFKKVWLKGFLMVLVIIAFSFVLGFALQALGLGNAFDVTYTEFSDIYSSYTDNLLSSLPQGILVSIVTFPLLAGFYRSCKEVDLHNNEEEFLFYYFKGEHFSKIALIALVHNILTLMAQTLFLVPFIYAFIPLSFFIVLYVFNPELKIGEIIELSFIFGTKKWFITFGVVFVIFLLAMVGIVACFIGILFTISLVYIPFYVVYKESIGFDDQSEIDEIGSHLIE